MTGTERRRLAGRKSPPVLLIVRGSVSLLDFTCGFDFQVREIVAKGRFGKEPSKIGIFNASLVNSQICPEIRFMLDIPLC